MVLVIPFKNEPKMHMIFGKSAVDFPVMMGILSWLKKRLQFSSGLNWNFFPVLTGIHDVLFSGFYSIRIMKGI